MSQHKVESTGAVTDVSAQHALIGVKSAATPSTFQRTNHPDAQWFPDAGLGLFLHWGGQ